MTTSQQNFDPYPGDDALPDLSNTRFDHATKDGKWVRFLWGAATSSYQVEGGIEGNDWSVFSTSAAVRERVDAVARLGKIVLNLEEPGNAVGEWDLDTFGKDVDRAGSLGLNCYRLSLEWSRIQPVAPSSDNPGDAQGLGFDQEAVLHYEKMLQILAEKGMEPIVTLNHFTLPRWILTPPTTILSTEDEGYKKSIGGWSSTKTVDAFVKYVEYVVERFHRQVKYWIPINEPTSLIGFGYLAGLWSPGFIAAEDRAKAAFFNLIDAHTRSYDAIRGIGGEGCKVGTAHAMVFPRLRPGLDILGGNLKAAIQYDYCFNRFFLESIIDGRWNPTMMDGAKDCVILENWKGRLDFIGINYYRSAYLYKNEFLSVSVPWAGALFDEDLSSSTEPHKLLNDLGWEIYPGGLYKFLKYLDKRFGLPIMVTENGLAEKSDPPPSGVDLPGKRGPFIVSHLSQILHAIKEGVDVIGYVHWSLVDNWEWDYDYLPKSRFGLYSVDRKKSDSNGNLPRKKTGGAQALEYVISVGEIGDAATMFGTISPSGDALIPPN